MLVIAHPFLWMDERLPRIRFAHEGVALAEMCTRGVMSATPFSVIGSLKVSVGGRLFLV